MKKLLLGFLCVGALASCNVKNSEEYKALQAQNDSLMQIMGQNKTDISDLMSIINEVNANFDQIKEAEKYLTVQANSKGELSADAKTRIKDNFQMINDILAKNKADIATLNQKIKNAGNQASQLKQTVERLNAELESRSNAIIELRDALATRDAQIASLTGTVQKLSSDVEGLSTKTAEQEAKIKEQDTALNTGYYIFGTSKELKEAKIISGGFLSSKKILNESIDKSVFVKIDIRKVKEIPVYAKNVKILSDQPKDSYSIVKDSNEQAVVKIIDYKRFWSLGQFLIMEVNL
jgi:chromosome segregation ATPase